MTIKTERRKKVRNRPRSLVYVELESANGGMMRDLSEEGFALRAMMPLQAGGKTQFAFSLDGTKRISGEGRIAWIKEDGRLAGIEFCGIAQSAREEIREWLAGAERPAPHEHRPAAFGASETATIEELRTEARRTLARVAAPKVEAVEAAPPQKTEIAPTPVAETAPPEKRREEIHPSVPKIALPTVKPAEAVPLQTAEIAATSVAETAPAEKGPEEVHASHPPIAILAGKAAESAPEVATEKNWVAIPSATLREEQQEETRFTLPRISLASVGSAAGSELTEAAVENVVAPSLEIPSESREVSGETEPVEVLEPLPIESRLEPLPELGAESEFSERVEEPLWRRFTLTRAIGIMVVLTLIASAVVGHRQVGHALIWLGQVIAGEEETAPPRSSNSESPSPASPMPENEVQVPLPAAPLNLTLPSPQTDGGAPAVTQAAASGATGAPPKEPTLSPAVTKTPSVPAIQPAVQQSRAPMAASSFGATTDNGQEEYQKAELILSEKKREAEIPEAARLLWAAVQKGNINAEVALADLYRKGKGVEKNCRQARILLSAAAQKGSVEARMYLGELVREGCE